MAVRAQLAIRATSLAGGTVLTVCMALAATAPASTASVARPAVLGAASAPNPAAAGPDGVQAKAAAIADAATGRVLWSRELNTERPMASITKVMTALYRGAIGIKTGFTRAAGHCLLFEATRDGRTLIGVSLGSPGVGTTVNGAGATRMLNWAFSLPAR